MPDILTTHVGSLPRGSELVPLLLARDHGKPYDAAAFEHVLILQRRLACAHRSCCLLRR